MPPARPLQHHAPSIVPDAPDLLNLLSRKRNPASRHRRKIPNLVLNRPRILPSLLNERRHQARHRRLRQIPQPSQLQGAQPVLLRNRPHPVNLRTPSLHPTRRPIRPVIPRPEHMPGPNIPMEQPTIIHHPRQHLHPELLRRRQHQSTRPRLQRIQNQHRPVNQLTVPLETVNQIIRKPIRRPRRHP